MSAQSRLALLFQNLDEYIQPELAGDDQTVIDFAAVASHVGRFDDEISLLFAKYLKRWTRRAGDPEVEELF